MEKYKYKSIVDNNTPKENILLNALVAFFIGGIMGVIGNFLIEFYSYILEIPKSDASIFMIITLIFYLYPVTTSSKCSLNGGAGKRT